MCLDLSSFFIPVSEAQQTSFILPGYTQSNSPLVRYLIDFEGLGIETGAKYATFFPKYPGGTGSLPSQEFVEWTFEREVVTGPLASLDPTIIDNSGLTSGHTGSDPYYRPNFSTDIVKIDGTLFGMNSTDAFAVATKGGLKIWSEIDGTLLFNTFNSKIASNELTRLAYSPNGTLWIGSADAGLIEMSWNDHVFYFTVSNVINSGLISNTVNDVFYSSNGYLAVATSAGISLFDIANLVWTSYSRTNVNIINDLSFSTVCIDTNFLLAGSGSGVYVYDMTAQTWSLFSSGVSGWSASNNVNRVISNDLEAFVATDNGIVTFSIGATSAVTIPLPSGLTGSYSNITDLIYAAGASGSVTLIASSDMGALAGYDLIGATWSFLYTGSTSSLLYQGTDSIALDGDVYFTNDLGFGRTDTTSQAIETLPTSTQTSDILFSYPDDGTFPVSILQNLYIVFSKKVDPTVLTNHIVFVDMMLGASVSYSLTSSDGYHYSVVPSTDLSYDSVYSFQILNGLTSEDGKYFKQTVNSTFVTYDRNPINGWNVLSKNLTLSGAEGRYVDSIVFRNPQSFDVEVTALIAI